MTRLLNPIEMVLHTVIDMVKPWNPHRCIDCHVDTSSSQGISEYYHVHNIVWCEAFGRDPFEVLDDKGGWKLDHIDCCQDKGMLCIGCLEQRLGRELEADDFSDAPINSYPGISERFRDRLSRR
jgi:hypothetical protein